MEASKTSIQVDFNGLNSRDLAALARRQLPLSQSCVKINGWFRRLIPYVTRRKTWAYFRTFIFAWRFTVLTFLVAACALGAAPELNDDSFGKMREFIRPRAEEQKFLEIGWHESFFTAVNEARETNRPILL